MGNRRGWGLRYVFVTFFLFATTYTSSGAQNTTVACFEHERLALLKFKHSVKDASQMLSSWVGNHCCQWERVTCDSVTGSVESLHIRGYRYSNEYLVSKELDASLGELRHLKYLDLSANDFGGRIPEFIGSLKQLNYLNLSNAYFSGIIPHHIGNLSNLVNLGLGPNELVAGDMTWISRLRSLEHLDLSTVSLSGARILDIVLYMIPSLKKLSLSGCGLSIVDLGPLRNLSNPVSNIKHLDLSRNSFIGKLSHFFHNMTSLQFLDLSESIDFGLTWNFVNFINMTPSLLGLRLLYCGLQETYLHHTLHNFTTLPNIQLLDLSYKDLMGPIPTFSRTVTKLYLSNNHLNGSIPESIGKLKLLKVLDLSYNELTGPVPTFSGKLTELYLSNNYLNGSIPESCGRLDALTTLSLEYNQLSGDIPVSIGQLSKLRSLDVSYNSLEGVVFESHFVNLSMLEELIAASNTRLIFNVSREWLPPFQLIKIDLSSCKIRNGFPQWLRNQRKLYILELSNATISGPLPTWLWKMPMIHFINLSHNNLSGPLTNLPSGGSYIKYQANFYPELLYLQNNTFSESIPRSLCKRTKLYTLNISRNRLTGKIPKCFKNLEYLRIMKLNSNGLSGYIPSFIGHFSSLLLLDLNDNKFGGELPAEIWNLNGLRVLDVGDNALCGKIPEWIGEKFKTFWAFRLHNSNFTGEIPQSLCTNLELQILDVAHNNFAGKIPRCLGELQGMVGNLYKFDFPDGTEEGLIQVMKGVSLEYTHTWLLVNNMDLSSNKLIGNIPVELTALHALMGLNLSNNRLSGGIPNTIGNMTALTSLDLSGNKLSGQIPPSIAALTFLSHLNLSNNNLSGRIPTGNQLQTLIDPSIYGGNKYLCGDPLPNNCSNQQDPTAIAKKKYETANGPSKVWFYLDIAWGFATGFWGVIIVLMLKKQWRRKLFVFVEETMDKIHVAVRVRVNKILTRGRGAI